MRNPPRSWTLPLALLLTALLPGCSVRKLAVNTLGGALAGAGDTYASDDDPELIGQALPFGLKTMEALLAETPANADLLLAASSGFTQYAYAYVQCEADYVEAKDLARATELRARAKKLYARALGYALRGLEVKHRDFRRRLRTDRAPLLAELTRADVPLLYWTGASWGASIALSKEDSELTADQGLVEAIMRRALELDETFGEGTIHDFFIAFEGGRPPSAGGSAERALEHLDRAVAISDGLRAAPYVSYAETVCVARQDRKEFETMLGKALAVNPDGSRPMRLANLIAQKRARWLLGRADELFLE